jgi:uncharacterized protein YjbI with pentapeptide repeats
MLDWFSSAAWTSPHELLFGPPNDELDLVLRKSKSVLSNRLTLASLDVIDHAKVDTDAKIMALPETVFLAGRHLEYAVLSKADLRKANFANAYLKGAFMGGAKLQGAILRRAELQDADLGNAELQGASLEFANLGHAFLNGAKLQGASLNQAKLGHAHLSGAELQGANLNLAELQGADFSGAKLQGASLEQAILFGTKMDDAKLQGAFLYEAQLQGAVLALADLGAVALQGAFVWRSDPPADAGKARDALISALKFEAVYGPPMCSSTDSSKCPWPPSEPGLLAGLEGNWRDPKIKLPEDLSRLESWIHLRKGSPTIDVYTESFIKRLTRIGCESNNATYVIRGLYLRIEDISKKLQLKGDPAAKLASAFLSDDSCFGARGLSDEDKEELRKIKSGEG